MGFPFWGTLWRGQVCEKGKHSELAKVTENPRHTARIYSPPGHAVVLRFGWCGIAGGVMDSAVLVVERCADSEVGGREGGPLAGLFPGWSIFVELYICFGNILWSR